MPQAAALITCGATGKGAVMSGAIYNVSDSAGLYEALSKATGGDTIKLAAGDYGSLILNTNSGFDFTYDGAVTITSEDPADQASFSKMVIHGGRNITFEDITFDYEFNSEDPVWHRPFEVSNSENITIRDSVFLGDVAEGVSNTRDGFGYAYGLFVRGGENIILENNEFTSWELGAYFNDIDGLTVSQNEFHDLRRDGVNLSDVRSVLIEGNHFHSFRDHPDSTSHRDFIQFWTTGTSRPNTDIVIRENILDIGEGSWTQSIFMRNEEVDTGRAGEEMFYQNVLIEENVIHNGHTHGITVGETAGLTIRNNSVLHAKSEMHGLEGVVTIPNINIKPASTSVAIEGNITGGITGYENQPGWTVDGNAIIQPAGYFEAFVTSSLDAVAGAHNFVALPGGLIETLQAGATRTQFDDAPDILTPQFQVHSDLASSHVLILDASLTVGPLGLVSESDADFLWSFGDGSTAEGRIVKHEYASPGHHDVTLTVAAKDGTTAQAQFTAGIVGDDVLQFDAQAGLFEVQAYGEETALDGSGLPLQNTADGHVLKLGGEGTQASIAASELSQFFGTDSFALSMSLKADSATSWGEVARIHMSFIVSVDQSGNLWLELFTDNGSRVRWASEGVSVNDGAVHDVKIGFDGKAGVAEIVIDGQPFMIDNVLGALGGDARDLVFGNPWNQKNFDGELGAFDLNASSKDYPVLQGPIEPYTGESDPSEQPDKDECALPGQDNYAADFAALSDAQLKGGAQVLTIENDSFVVLDGRKDYVDIGRLEMAESTDQLSFSVDFSKAQADQGHMRLVWNHDTIGLKLTADGLAIRIGLEDGSFSKVKAIRINSLGLDDTETHQVVVLADAAADHLQVILDGELVLDRQDLDIEFPSTVGNEQGWTLGTNRKPDFYGEIYDFHVDASAEFMLPADDSSLVA